MARLRCSLCQAPLEAGRIRPKTDLCAYCERFADQVITRPQARPEMCDCGNQAVVEIPMKVWVRNALQPIEFLMPLCFPCWQLERADDHGQKANTPLYRR